MIIEQGVAAPEATYGFTEQDSPQASDVQIAPVTAHGWRVSDTRLPSRDPMRLLGYIEHRGDVFEVLQLGAGFELHEFPSLEEALGYVVATGPRVAWSRMHDELGSPC